MCDLPLRVWLGIFLPAFMTTHFLIQSWISWLGVLVFFTWLCLMVYTHHPESHTPRPIHFCTSLLLTPFSFTLLVLNFVSVHNSLYSHDKSFPLISQKCRPESQVVLWYPHPPQDTYFTLEVPAKSAFLQLAKVTKPFDLTPRGVSLPQSCNHLVQLLQISISCL